MECSRCATFHSSHFKVHVYFSNLVARHSIRDFLLSRKIAHNSDRHTLQLLRVLYFLSVGSNRYHMIFQVILAISPVFIYLLCLEFDILFLRF